MKDRKQNPALLIATLGVYLGLVLAGAAPSVLANAALSKQFNVRDEIEFVDEFDNKPDHRISASVAEHSAQAASPFTFEASGLWETRLNQTPGEAAKVLDQIAADTSLFRPLLRDGDSERDLHLNAPPSDTTVIPTTRLARGSLDPHFAR